MVFILGASAATARSANRRQKMAAAFDDFFPGRGGRATAATPADGDQVAEVDLAGATPDLSEKLKSSEEADANASLIKTLIESVLIQESARTAEPVVVEPARPDQSAVKYLDTPLEESLLLLGKNRPLEILPQAAISDSAPADDEYFKEHAYERKVVPRNVEGGLSNFGAQMAELEGNEADLRFNALPQLAEFSDPEPVAMNLLNEATLRQADGGDAAAPGFTELPNSSDDEVRCIPKVMQVRQFRFLRNYMLHARINCCYVLCYKFSGLLRAFFPFP